MKMQTIRTKIEDVLFIYYLRNICVSECTFVCGVCMRKRCGSMCAYGWFIRFQAFIYIFLVVNCVNFLQ